MYLLMGRLKNCIYVFYWNQIRDYYLIVIHHVISAKMEFIYWPWWFTQIIEMENVWPLDLNQRTQNLALTMFMKLNGTMETYHIWMRLYAVKSQQLFLWGPIYAKKCEVQFWIITERIYYQVGNRVTWKRLR